MERHKIHWDLEKDKFPYEVRSVLICQVCGWLVGNPRADDSKKCSNCGVKITNSIEEIKREKKK